MPIKKSKIKQTDYTRGGRDISNTAIPLYQDTLRAMGDYNNNTQSYIDSYLDKYYGANTARNNDFIRNYNRAMTNRAASNYSATGGGYSSAGQRAYDDSQRYYNDLASRMYDQGVSTSAQMAQNYYNNLLSGASTYNNAYKLGEDYSNIDQYNDQIDQSRNNWIGNVMNVAGDVGMSSGNPWGVAIGAALKTGSNFVGKDTTQAENLLLQKMGGKGVTSSTDSGNFGDVFNGLYNAGKTGMFAKDNWKFWDKGKKTGSAIGNAVGNNAASAITQAVQGMTAPRSDGYNKNFSLFGKGN